MKQTSVYYAVSLLFVFVLLTSCKKNNEKWEPLAENTSGRGIHGDCDCRLSKLWFSDVAYVGLHYNNQGLADQWVTHYDDANIETYNIEYQGGRMKKAVYDFNGELQNTIYFYYTGNKLTKEVWNDADGNLFMTTYDSYNSLGQIVKRENSMGVKVLFYNNSIGNTPLIKTYINNELSVVYEYSYNQPNRNPYAAIPGIPFGFPYMELTFSTWWETSQKATEYIDGVPTVLYAVDPSQTVLGFGECHSLTSVFNYDYIYNESYSTTFDYENCGTHPGNYKYSNSGTSKKFNPAKSTGALHLQINRILNGKNGEEIKRNLRKLKIS